MDKKKIEYLLSVNRQLRDAIAAVEAKEKKTLKPLFSKILQTFNDLDVPDDIEEVIKNGDFDIPKLDFMLEGKNEFEKHPKIFLRQFQYIILICASGVFDGDKRLDPLMMDALFVAGQHFERLKAYGYKWSDEKSRNGSKQHKGCVSHKEVIQTAKDVVERLKTLGIKPTKRRVGHDVRERLLKSEIEKEKPKEVYKEDNIRNKILKDVWSEIL